MVTLQPCALNAEFQHFILRFDKNFPNFADTTKRGDGGESRPKKRVKTG